MSAGMIHSYPVTATTFNDTSFWDLDKDLGSGNWESQKVPHLLLRQLILSENVEQILEADLQALATANGLLPLKTYICDGPDRLLAVRASTVSALYQTAIDMSTGEIGVYDLTTGVFLSTNGLIETLTKAAFDAKIAASELIIGKQYIVTGAFTSAVFAYDWDVLCVADSVSTVRPNATIVNAPPIPLPCEYDPIAPLVKVGTVSQGLSITPTIADTWGSISPTEVFPYSFVYVAGGSVSYEIQVSEDASTLILTNARRMSDGVYGTYDPATDTFTANAANVVTFKKTLTAANIIAAGSFDIAELPAVAGAYWNVESVQFDYTFGTVAFDGGARVIIGINTAGTYQYTDGNYILALTNNDMGRFLTAESLSGAVESNIAVNRKAQVTINTPSTVGDGTLVIYGTARLVTL